MALANNIVRAHEVANALYGLADAAVLREVLMPYARPHSPEKCMPVSELPVDCALAGFMSTVNLFTCSESVNTLLSDWNIPKGIPTGRMIHRVFFLHPSKDEIASLLQARLFGSNANPHDYLCHWRERLTHTREVMKQEIHLDLTADQKEYVYAGSSLEHMYEILKDLTEMENRYLKYVAFDFPDKMIEIIIALVSGNLEGFESLCRKMNGGTPSKRIMGSGPLAIREMFSRAYSEQLKGLAVAEHNLRLISSHRRNIRNLINEASRKSCKPRKIMDLPNEMLSRIIGHIGADEVVSSNSDPGAFNDLSNLRLTCHKFNAEASRRFIETIRIDCNSKSLARFEGISHSPILAKNILEVRVSLSFFERSLSESLTAFARYGSKLLGEMIDDLSDETILRVSRGLPGPLVSEALVAFEAIRMSRYWQSFREDRATIEINQKSSDAEIQEFRDYYLRCFSIFDWHKLYVEKFNEQEKCRPTFAQAIGEAFKRLPNTPRLVLTDDDSRNQGRYLGRRPRIPRYDILSRFEAFGNEIMRPFTWKKAQKYSFEIATPTGLLREIPIALHEAGVALTDLSIAVTKPKLMAENIIQCEDETFLSSIQRLKNFGFRSRMPNFKQKPAHTETELHDIHAFLSPILSGGNFEQLTIDLGPSKNSDVSMGLLLSQQNWDNLTHLCIKGIGFKFSDLQRLFRRLDKNDFKPLKHMHSTTLIDGSWIDALNLIESASNESTRFESPHGREYHTGCNHEDRERIFLRQKCMETHRRNKAELFVRGLIEWNPLMKEKYTLKALRNMDDYQSMGDEDFRYVIKLSKSVTG